MINRLIEPTSGTISLDGESTSGMDPALLRRRIGYVIQHAGLFPHRTIVDNIATMPRLLGKSKKESRSRAMELLETVDSRSISQTGILGSCPVGNSSESGWLELWRPTRPSC